MGCDAALCDIEFCSVVTVALALPPCQDFPDLTSARPSNGQLPSSNTTIMAGAGIIQIDAV
jgi:hypothetical protein